MWLTLAFCSAVLLGFYDVFKKQSLKANAVMPVLFLNTLFATCIFLPFILVSAYSPAALSDTHFCVPQVDWHVHKYILLKALIVLSSWALGYIGIKHLPLTIVGPINATRPVLVLVGAMVIYGERLNLYQWIGVVLAIVSFFLLKRSGKKEGIDFWHNRWIVCIVLAAMMGAVSGLYDKFLLAPTSAGGLGIDKMVVQSWFNVYQMVMMGVVVLLVWWPHRHEAGQAFTWSWCIPFIAIFLAAADFLYYYALSQDGAMVSIVSMVRRGSVVVSFLCGALVFNEKNVKSKAIDLALVLLGMYFLYLGSR